MQYESDNVERNLIGIATAAVFEIVSPSARSNVTDAVASQAIEEYLRALDNGEIIENPHGWVQVTARRRAIDAMRKWKRDKQNQDRIDIRDDAADGYFSLASGTMRGYLDGDRTSPRSVDTALWIEELIGLVITDPTNRIIAIRCIVGDDKPGEVAHDLNLAAPAVSSRIARIKAKLRDELTVEELLG